MGYKLSDGPEGETVHWRMAFTDRVRFRLDQAEADLPVTGDCPRWCGRRGAPVLGWATDPCVVPLGDLGVLQTVGRVFALAQAVATVPVEFPDV